jgi:tRNA threonylcarbamoyladenosine biosynthesis protein TsaE
LKTEGHRRVESLKAFHDWVRDFSTLLKGDEILLLSGEMGAGKTEFVKALARLSGIQDAASPTFALHHSMRAGSKIFDHYDLYRVEGVDELETTGFWDILQSPSLVLVEWPERVPHEFWPADRTIFSIRIEKAGENSREISWRRGVITPP